MKSRKLRTVLIVIAAMIFAYAVVLFVLTQVQTSKMDDHFARAERQVFSLDAEKITYIAVQNGNGELYEFTGGEKAAAIDKLNAFEATRSAACGISRPAAGLTALLSRMPTAIPATIACSITGSSAVTSACAAATDTLTISLNM